MSVVEAREFPFDAEHFRVISERMYQFSGIRLPEAKREMVYARLARRLRALGIQSFDDYVRFLELEPAEWEHCSNALTTNVTAFYREEHHFATLAEHARATRRPGEAFRVWSAGCSTGEEPYTIAMCLTETIGAGSFRVIASDLDTQVIAQAAEGVYPLQHVQALPVERQKRFFLRGAGRYEGKARVRPEREAPSIMALDCDGLAVNLTRKLAKGAGVALTVERLDVMEFAGTDPAGHIVTNPPYGVRISRGEDFETSLAKALNLQAIHPFS